MHPARLLPSNGRELERETMDHGLRANTPGRGWLHPSHACSLTRYVKHAKQAACVENIPWLW